jgi:hypothetical protein
MSEPQPIDPGAAGIVEGYLDDYARQLGLSDPGARRLLGEASDHLYSDLTQRVSAGADPQDAAEAAIAAFGDPPELADAARPWARLLSSTWLFAAAGLIAIGLSGLVANVFGSIWGWSFVAGDPAGLTYSPQRCAEYLTVAPDAGNCQSAALVDHYSEVVDQRVLAGVVGVVVVLAYVWWRRHGGVPASQLLVGGVAVVSFGLAGVFQLANAATSSQLDQGMVGAWLAGGIVALAFAVAFLPMLAKGMRADG